MTKTKNSTRFSSTLFLAFFFWTNFTYAQEDTPVLPDIFINGNFAFTYIEDFETPLAFGIGTEARLNERFSVGGTYNYGANREYSRLFINPSVKFYPKQVFRGFFLQGGISYNQIRSRDELFTLGFPFDNERGSEVSFFNFSAGVGLSTLVKDRWMVGYSFL
ncbi:MAG: hypothetical protein AAF573_08590 [Bacteroidota bacterium]